MSQKSGVKGYRNLEPGRRRNLYPEVNILDSGGAEFWYQEVQESCICEVQKSGIRDVHKFGIRGEAQKSRIGQVQILGY